jgi:chromatin remodeling complex protein RSC6
MPKAKKNVKGAEGANTKSTPKVAAPKVVAAKPETVVEPVVSETVESAEPSLTDDFSTLFGRLQQITTMLSALRTECRALEKRATRELKQAHKLGQKRKKKSGNRSPSGFVKPTLISNELAAFLRKDQGTEMARTEVTREINAYIRKHSLQDSQNGRKINPDSALQKLLKLDPKTDELTYFNLQRYMSPHFAKGGAAPLAETS